MRYRGICLPKQSLRGAETLGWQAGGFAIY